MAAAAVFTTVRQARFDKIVYMPCTDDNGFLPEFPEGTCRCGSISASRTIQPVKRSRRPIFRHGWTMQIRMALSSSSMPLTRLISQKKGIPHSIYECEGAKDLRHRGCAAFPKGRHFTGMRPGFAVIPKDLKCGDVSLKCHLDAPSGLKV